MENVTSTILGFVSYLPVLIVWGVGAVLCVSNWQSRPRKAQLTLAAIAVSFLNLAVAVVAVPVWMALGGHEHVELFFGIQRIVHAVLNAGAWGLILMAIFKTE